MNRKQNNQNKIRSKKVLVLIKSSLKCDAIDKCGDTRIINETKGTSIVQTSFFQDYFVVKKLKECPMPYFEGTEFYKYCD